jgi:cytoskeletal protein RodZ
MLSLGEELKREREFREISLREISEATKINMRMLEAIEKDNYQLLPGGIFNRNFIRAYAEFIGLDPEIAVRKYQVQTSSQPDIKLAPEAISLLAISEVATPSEWKKWIIVALIAIVALGGALFWLYSTNQIKRFLPHIAKMTASSGIHRSHQPVRPAAK